MKSRDLHFLSKLERVAVFVGVHRGADKHESRNAQKPRLAAVYS